MASVGALALHTITNGGADYSSKSAVPLSPEQFSERMEAMVFASPTADMEVVCDLYRRIFPTIAQKKRLDVVAWGDEDAQDLLDNLAELTGLKDLRINNWADMGCTAEISDEMKATLETTFAQRGGGFQLLGHGQKKPKPVNLRYLMTAKAMKSR